MRRRTRLTLLSALVATSCAPVRVAETQPPASIAWPPQDPRVRLEAILERRGERGLLSLLSGSGRGPALQRPYGLAWRDRDLLVADPGGRRILRVRPGGRAVASPEGLLGAVTAVASCRDGVVTTDSEAGRVGLLGEDLRLSKWLAEGLHRPTGVACGEDAIFVAETAEHRILTLMRDGTRRVWGGRGAEPGRFNFPTALAAAGAELLVGDTLNFRVQRLDAATGVCRGAFGRLGDGFGDMPRLKGLAVDPRGVIWVSDAHLDSVSLYDQEGALLMSLGSTGSEPGRFSFPAGIAAHADGRVAVADSLNGRIQILRGVTPAR